MLLTKEEVEKVLDGVIEDSKKMSTEEKQDAITSLYEMKKLATTTTEELAKALEEYKAILNKVNGTICALEGHSFGDWEEHENPHLDRSWYYERTCFVCWNTERTCEEPSEYIVKDSKTGQVLRKQRGKN